jgi:hypothetical protein
MVVGGEDSTGSVGVPGFRLWLARPFLHAKVEAQLHAVIVAGSEGTIPALNAEGERSEREYFVSYSA